MALEVRDVRQAIDESLQYKIAESVIDGNSQRTAELVTIRKVAAKLTDEAIDDALVALFVELEAKFRES